jgi:hypothetical protein
VAELIIILRADSVKPLDGFLCPRLWRSANTRGTDNRERVHWYSHGRIAQAAPARTFVSPSFRIVRASGRKHQSESPPQRAQRRTIGKLRRICVLAGRRRQPASRVGAAASTQRARVGRAERSTALPHISGNDDDASRKVGANSSAQIVSNGAQKSRSTFSLELPNHWPECRCRRLGRSKRDGEGGASELITRIKDDFLPNRHGTWNVPADLLHLLAIVRGLT